MPMKTFEIQNILSVYTLSQLSTGRAGGGMKSRKTNRNRIWPHFLQKRGRKFATDLWCRQRIQKQEEKHCNKKGSGTDLNKTQLAFLMEILLENKELINKDTVLLVIRLKYERSR